VFKKKNLQIYNALTRKKEVFKPIKPPFVGMYVCGPTVYNDVHLGNVRTFITFDIIYRYLQHLNYKVRYVRNITDAGHLEDDEDGGEDKIEKKARQEKLEPMEVVDTYTRRFHKVMSQFNLSAPNIEPRATGHIIEQINMVKAILKAGYAYEVNGSVYFDVSKYDTRHNYGKLSGRVIEELMASERELDKQDEKRNKIDFALWKKAAPGHIMKWDSPWGKGFPGWHLECSVMSTKYLGETFDIHGGGMDLKFPHHECEIAQSVASTGVEPVKYWIYGNMLTVNGQKMSKSLGNSFLPEELFTGNHSLLKHAYSPMTVKFFMLQTHYASTLDFSNQALQAAEKGYKRLMEAYVNLKGMAYEEDKSKYNETEDKQINELCEQCYEHMNDDFNTAQTLARLFDLANKINAFKNKQLPVSVISKATFDKLQKTYYSFVIDILGLKLEADQQGENRMTKTLDGLINIFIKQREEARNKKDFARSDEIRKELSELGIILKDGKEGTRWTMDN